MKLEPEIIIVIREKFAKIKDKKDLLNLMNYSKSFVFRENFTRFTLNQLTYFSNPLLFKKRYETFYVPKKSGEPRIIHAPSQGLKTLLIIFNTILQCVSEPHRLAFGFVLNKSIVDNANIHLNKNFVYNIDLKDFFHSFDRKRVKLAFTQEPFNLKNEKEPLAFLLACLCTHPILIDDSIKIVLPQGSPTSPTLTNIMCITLDRRLNGLAKKVNAKYSRYADDITFSSNKNVFNDETFQSELKRIIEENQSLKINPKKTRLQNSNYRQEVTGLVVNKKSNVKSRYIKQIRMWIYYWEKYGYFKAQHLFFKDYTKDKAYSLNTHTNLKNVLSGKLDFLKMVKGEKNSTYLTLKNRFTKLTSNNTIKKGSVELHVNKLNDVLTILLNEGIQKAMKNYNQSL
jgi:RNA-directed DNA polymerase